MEDFYDLDDDGDGYSDAEEVAYGSDPRDAASNWKCLQPVGLSAVGGLQIMENQSVGTLVGVLSATDADTDDLLRYELLAGEGDSGNHWFVLDANGSLYSSTIFDYETNATQYAIRARALDEANASVEVSLIVDLLNVVEDIDGDGIEDHYDLQDDRIEIPTSEIGPDGMLYEISENKYTLYEAKKFALREEAVIPAIKVLPWNAPLDPLTEYLRGFLIAELGRKGSAWVLTDSEDRDYILTARRGLRPMRDTKKFRVLIGRVPPVAGPVVPEFGLSVDRALKIQENQPAGTIIGSFIAPYADKNATSFVYSFENVEESFDNELFELESNGLLKSVSVFDYESDKESYQVRVRVRDDKNASLVGTFKVSLINQVEDLDGDGIEDAFDADKDGDRLADSLELTNLTDPLKFDTDGDGLWDKIEMDIGTNPLSIDSNNDGLDDLAQLTLSRLADGRVSILDENESFEGFLGPDGKLYSLLQKSISGEDLDDFLDRESLQLADVSSNAQIRIFVLSLLIKEQVEAAWVKNHYVPFEDSNGSSASRGKFVFHSHFGIEEVVDEEAEMSLVVVREVSMLHCGNSIARGEKRRYPCTSSCAFNWRLVYPVSWVCNFQKKIFGWENDPETHFVEVELLGSEFEGNLNSFADGTRWFLRAFAGKFDGQNIWFRKEVQY